MVNPGAFRGSRKEFLMGEKAAYSEAVTGGYAKDALMLIQRRYFKRYPLDLPHDDEPSAEHLAAINDDEPDPEPNVPDPTELPFEEYLKAMAEREERQKLLEFRKAQIRRWLAYQHMKDQDLDPKESGAHNPYRALLAKLTGKDGNRPRCKSHTNVWRKTQREAIEEELKKRMGDLTGKKTKLAAERNKIAREMFQALDDEEKQHWGKMAVEEHEVALKAWKKETEYAPSNDPAERQRCIQGLVRFSQPILDMICEVTGWKASLIAGGPEPAHGGRLNIISIHSGTTSGDIKMTFGRAERLRYKKYLIPMYGSFLQKCYTPEDCRACALPDAEGFMPMKSLDEDNDDATNFDTYDPSTEPATQSVSSSRPSPLPAQSTAANRPPALTAQSATAVGARPSRPAASTQTATSNRPSTRPAQSDRPSTQPAASTRPPGPTARTRAARIPPTRQAATASLGPAPRAVPSAPPAVVPPEINPTSATIDTLTAHTAVSAPSVSNSPEDDEMSNPFPHDIQHSPGPTPPVSRGPSPVPSLMNSPAVSRGPSPVPSLTNSPAASPAPTAPDVPVAEPPASVDHTPRVVGEAMAEGAGEKKGSKRRRTLSMARAREDPPAKRLQTRKGGAAERTSSSKGASAPSPAAEPLPPAKRRQTRKATTAVPAPLPSTVEPLVPVQAPSDSPKWFKNALSMFESATLDSNWTKLLRAWADFESDEDYKEYARLGANHRPLAVAEWIARARAPKWRPTIPDVSKYGADFIKWWASLQPDWRVSGDGTTDFGAVDGDWDVLRRPGVNGLLSVMAALFYWGVAAQKIDEDQTEWITAVKDCTTALTHLRRK